MTILNESGTPDVLPPLHAANSLAERLPGALVVVVGTRAEAHLVQSLPAASVPGFSPSPRNPRVVFMVLDAEAPPEQGRISSGLVEAAAGFRGLKIVFVVAGRSARLLGVDARFEAELAGRRLDLPVRALDPEAFTGAPAALSTDLVDRALAALVDVCPQWRSSNLPEPRPAPPKRVGLFGGLLGRTTQSEERHKPHRPVVLMGGLEFPGAAQELVSELVRADVEVTGSLPVAGRETGLPAIGEGTLVAVLDPNVTAGVGAAEERGARRVETLMPIGVDGTARFIQDVATWAGSSSSELGRARAVWQDLQPLRNRIRGKRIFFAGDTGLEIPLARFLADAGAVVLEVGAPRLNKRFLADELHALGPDVDVVEAPDWRGQIERIEKTRPDAVVCSRGLYAPLVARGHLCRSSQDFLRLGIYGYGGARRILELFARTFEHAEALDRSLDL